MNNFVCNKRVLISFVTRLCRIRFYLPVILLWLVFFPQLLYGQHIDLKFTALNSKDGLSGNTVNRILKDHTGMLWLVLPEGLDRYDGKTFRFYNLGNAGSRTGSREINAIYEDEAGTMWAGTMGGGLFYYDRQNDVFVKFGGKNFHNNNMNSYVNALCTDGNGKLWIGTAAGLYSLDSKTFKVTRFNAEPNLSVLNVTSIFRDNLQNMWVGTTSGLYLYDKKQSLFSVFRHNAENNRSLGSDSVNTICQDKLNQIWVGTANGLCRLGVDGRNFRTFRYDYKNKETLCGNLVYCISADDHKNIWVGTEGGLNIVDVKSGKVTRYQHDPRNPFSLKSKSIRSIYIDPSGIYWIGTYMGGINKFDKNLTLFNIYQSVELDINGLNSPFISSFAEKKDGDIYIGTDGGGLNLFHIGTKKFEHVNIQSAEKINSAGLPILTMLIDHKQQLWIGTYGHGLFRLNSTDNSYKQYLQGSREQDINQNNIFCLKEDRSSKIWIGTNGAGLNVYDPITDKFNKYPPSYFTKHGGELPFNGYIRAIEEDSQGNIWIGSYGTGIIIYHPESRTFTALNPRNTGFPIENVLSLFKDNNGSIWIGTAGEGLFYYDVHSQKIFAFQQNNKLPNGFIFKILQDEADNIWFSTSRNICRFNPLNQRLNIFSEYNGLQGESFMTGSGIRSKDNMLFFGGADGFNYIRAEDVKLNKNIPRVVLTTLSVDKKEKDTNNEETSLKNISQSKQVTINYKQDFSINFAALNYTLPQQNRYAYILEGFNRSWKYVGPLTTGYYTNIDPGEYTFKVKACNNDGIWNDTGASIRIIIKPPFWMTIWAYTLYGVVVLTGLWLMRKIGIRRIKKEMAIEQLRKDAETRHDLDNLKIKFLTNLSHEFRTPISLIIAPADQLLSQYNDQHMSNQINVIKRNARRLLNLVNQLLDFKKLEEHELNLNCTEGEFMSFILDIIDSFQDLADIKNIKINIDYPKIKLFALFDHDKVERIFFNVISNALKFTPAGGFVAIKVAEPSFDETRQTYTLYVTISDTGIGLSKDQLLNIFDRFYQGDAPASIVNQGSGIGLSITKELIDLHHGNISVSSEPSKGSVFSIQLPLQAINLLSGELPNNESNPIEDDSAKKTKTDLHSRNSDYIPNVLIIDDNLELLFYLEDNLKMFYKITKAENGREGWHKALSKHPDLIISDISMPYMDGIALSRKLKADKRTSHIPVILLTAQTGMKEQLEGLKTGAADYLTKPFNFDMLHLKINNLLKLNRSLKETYQKQLKIVPNDEGIESASEKFLHEIVLYIEQNFNSPRFSVEDLSHQFGMSRGSLYSKIMELTGQPPVDFIRTIKLSKAAILLEKSDLTISEIAYKCGFATPHYFTKSFKVKYNMLPSDYRSKNGELISR